MTPNEEKILEKVRRLFALAESSNVHEAEAAMLKAQELLHKYQLDESQLPRDEKAPFVREFISPKNKADWANALMGVIARANGVRMVNDRSGQVALMGQRHAIEITIYGYQQVETKIRWLADLAWDIEEDKWRYRNDDREFKLGYSTGAVASFSKKLQANKERITVQDAASTALVRTHEAEVAQFVHNLYPYLTKTRRGSVNGSAYGAGSGAGRFIDINAGLSGGGAGRRMLS